ncbi:hypothetical protein K3495_g6988 [Podosphaera aphanis]|nr:hypothetical protein K3495_g6988 [Podosphaera aphanis]
MTARAPGRIIDDDDGRRATGGSVECDVWTMITAHAAGMRPRKEATREEEENRVRRSVMPRTERITLPWGLDVVHVDTGHSIPGTPPHSLRTA